jgi:hypothetical protein
MKIPKLVGQPLRFWVSRAHHHQVSNHAQRGMSNLWRLEPSGGLLATDLTHTRVLLAQSFQKQKPSTKMLCLWMYTPVRC